MKNFTNALHKKITNSLSNNFGIENYDEYRFDTYPIETEKVPKKNPKGAKLSLRRAKTIIKKIIGHNPLAKHYLSKADILINNYEDGLQKLWDHHTIDKDLLLSIISYRILGYKKVKLPRNNKAYWDTITLAKTLMNPTDYYDPKFLHFMLYKFDLTPIGLDIKLYFTQIGIAINFILEQYVYKKNGKPIIEVEAGDTVLDLGGCWGDTALYFAHKTGTYGKIFTFEFIPDNIKLFNLNTSFNPSLSERIELIPRPISNISGETIYYEDHGPGSKVESNTFNGYTGTAITLSIDDFVEENEITKVDFIKMDIEGAEPKALEGAIETIKRFKPKLAVAIYHSMDDFVNIPNWILGLNLGYEIFIDHFTIHTEETICFAQLSNNKL